MAGMYKEEMRKSEKDEIRREDIKTAIGKAVELRALHAALMQGNTPPTNNPRFLPSASPYLSAQDYPVFTPSYDDALPGGYQQILNRNYAESWGEHTYVDESDFNRTPNESSSRIFFNIEPEGDICCPPDDQFSCATNTNPISTDRYSSKSRRHSMGDIKSVSSCNKCRPAIISSDSDGLTTKNGRKSNIIVPLTDSHSSLHSQPKNYYKGLLGLSRLFPRLKKKTNNGQCGDEQVSQVLKDLGIVSLETLKKELIEANECRDEALSQVADMKSSLGELNRKLEYLETYCEELKNAMKQEKLTNILPKRGKSIDGGGNAENAVPVSERVMVEGFLQIASEARLSVKQFCKALVGQIEETDYTLVDNLNMMLLPYKLSLNSKYSKAVLYHLEAIINQSLYQDFENCVFQKNGAQKHLDPQQDRQVRFQSFVALRNLSWNEVLRKGTKYYSEEFSKFCDQKMSGIIATLGCTRPWPEQLLQAFFVAAKCIWLLHLLAFSFIQPLGILRVDENMPFEPSYMEDIAVDRQRSQGPSRVKIMVMPGFYVLDGVLRCKVLCRYKSAS